ncbi:MAG: autotransporter domain-containing protein [Gammaproteobacteria bacterium]|nr:autotransporter domain-containing protein [Gammaproteobacteria bacterium]
MQFAVPRRTHLFRANHRYSNTRWRSSDRYNKSRLLHNHDTGIHAVNFGNGVLSIASIGTVTGTSENGIYALHIGTGNITINSSGAVTGGDDGIDAYHVGTGNITITASGAVTGGDDGIDVEHYGASAGAITINVLGAVTGNDKGITIDRDNNSPATITSHAPVTSTAANGFAIDLRGNAHDTVNLGGGTMINGFIDFGNGDAADIDTLNALPGFNGVVTFADNSGSDSALLSAPENISSNIALIGGGTTAVAFDPSGFAASGMFLGSFTGTILNSIDNGGTPAANGSAANSFTGLQANGLSQRHWVSGLGGRQEIKTTGVSSFSANGVATPYAEGSGPTYWVSGFGGQQEIEADSNNVDLDNTFAGIMAGAENNYDGGIIGVLGGYGASDIDIDYDAGSTETDSLFAGAYWKKDYGTHRVNLALIGGSADQEFRRNIAGSTSPAKGKADGWFISPSATFTVPIKALPITTFGSVRVSYSGLFLDGYTESGVANPLDVSDRDMHLLNARAQLTFPHDFENRDGSHSHLEIRAGVDAQYDMDSDKVNGVVGGTAIKFSADLDDKVSGFIGATFTRSNHKGDLAFAISGELQSTFDGGYQAVAEVRVIKRF